MFAHGAVPRWWTRRRKRANRSGAVLTATSELVAFVKDPVFFNTACCVCSIDGGWIDNIRFTSCKGMVGSGVPLPTRAANWWKSQPPLHPLFNPSAQFIECTISWQYIRSLYAYIINISAVKKDIDFNFVAMYDLTKGVNDAV